MPKIDPLRAKAQLDFLTPPPEQKKPTPRKKTKIEKPVSRKTRLKQMLETEDAVLATREKHGIPNRDAAAKQEQRYIVGGERVDALPAAVHASPEEQKAQALAELRARKRALPAKTFSPEELARHERYSELIGAVMDVAGRAPRHRWRDAEREIIARTEHLPEWTPPTLPAYDKASICGTFSPLPIGHPALGAAGTDRGPFKPTEAQRKDAVISRLTECAVRSTPFFIFAGASLQLADETDRKYADEILKLCDGPATDGSLDFADAIQPEALDKIKAYAAKLVQRMATEIAGGVQ